jgi:hypothetical protein
MQYSAHNPDPARLVCHCKAYAFPHRIGSGPCEATYNTAYRTDPTDYRVEFDPICSECGLASESKEVNEGIGCYEFWGAPGVDNDWVRISECCGAPMAPNSADTVKDIK